MTREPDSTPRPGSREDAAAPAMQELGPAVAASLGTRLRPLLALLAFLVALSAPVAFYVVSVGGLRTQAESLARKVGRAVAQEVRERPALWRYDTPKVALRLRLLEEYEPRMQVVVTDGAGHPVRPLDAKERQALGRADRVWGHAPIAGLGARPAGHVWVAASLADVRERALLLAVPFALLALALAGGLYLSAMAEARRADARIGALLAHLRASRAQLARLAEGLEVQVEARSQQLAEALAELRLKEARLRELSQRAVAALEDERRAIGRDLHDSAGQALTAIRIHLQVIAQHPEAPEVVREHARRTFELVDRALAEIRRAVRALGPAVLDDVGLREALVRMCEDMAEAGGLDLELALDPALPADPATDATVYRVVQEAMTNVVRHARARRVGVSVSVDDDGMTVAVTDDGQGFVPGDRSGSHGMSGMRERVELLGGELDVDSTPGGGTRVHARVPVGRDASGEARPW